ncbi:MAG TPA: hypothetical protein VME20_00640 [Acidimicrobiales bacterium]|nr:hypothetical protein [Acidimicrobiales bacterium]
MRLSASPGRLVEVASGVDALYLSGRAAPPASLLETLEELRSRAAARKRDLPVLLGDEEFRLSPYGFGKYRFCLRHEHGLVGITPSAALPAVRVQPRTEFLHGVGPALAVLWFQGTLEELVGPLRLSVSRLDLHADWQGWSINGDERWRFVCQAERRDLHELDGKLLGFEFGRRTTGTICARIYDKTAEQKEKGTDFWLLIWGERFDPSRPVHRVEFEFGREGLRDFGVDTPDEVLGAAGALWASVTEHWLTYRSPTSDSNRSRWPVAPEWHDVQRASVRGGAYGLRRMYDGARRGELRKLMPYLNGCLVGFGALCGAAGIQEVCSALPGCLQEYESVTGRLFSERVAERARKYEVA